MSYTPKWLIKLDEDKYMCRVEKPLLSRVRCMEDLLRMLKPVRPRKWKEYFMRYTDALSNFDTKKIDEIAQEICRELGITLVIS